MSKSSIENTELKKQAFLDHYPTFQKATKTSLAIGITDQTHYAWMNTDEEYNKAFKALKKRLDSDRLEENEAEIHRRGLEKSDLLLMFETKKLDTDYRDKVPNSPMIGDIKIVLAIPAYDEKLRITDGDIIEGEAREITDATE